MSSQEVPRKRLKAGITRVRTGCYTCRRRKVKCDETKPTCRACCQLRLHCEGYAPRYKFCAPQNLETIQWATSVVPEPSSPLQQSLSPSVPGSCDLSLYSATSGSFADSDNLSELFSPVAGTLKHSEPSLAESCTAGSQIKLNPISHELFSPFNNTFFDPAWDSGLSHDPDSNFLDTRTGLPADNMGLSPEDTTSPSEYAETSHQPITSDNILSNFNEHVYQDLLLTRLNNTPPLSELYFIQWQNSVAPLLPPVFRDIITEMPEFPPLRNTVLAISAAYVAHLESLIVRTAHRNSKSRYIPQKDHQYQSLQYYNKGIQGIGKSFQMLLQINPLHVLAALLLSYYFELDSGSFTGGIGHMSVIDKFLSSNRDRIKSSQTGQRLLCTWMNLRSQFVNRYLGGYSSSKPSHNIDTFPLDRMIGDGGSHYDSITIIMCDCKLINRRIILDWCVARQEHRSTGNKTPFESILTQMSLPKSRKVSVSQMALIDDLYRQSLEKQREKLDKWHSSLDLSELPIDSYVSRHQDLTRQSTTELDILPLKFHTFEAAMNYAYYAHAQMLCSQDVIHRLESPTFVEPPFTRKDCPWAELILRITSGLHVADCIYKNTFNAGILSILTACMVVCPRVDVASWIEEWIRKLEDFGVPLESGLPFGIIKRIIRLILSQRANGRDVLLTLPLDIEDVERSDLYHSDFKMQVVVCGKHMSTGELYSEIVEIPEV